MAFGVSGDGLAAAATRFGAHVVRGRWFMFFASILIMAAAGGTYIFGIYSKAIKTSLGYDQQTLSTLSFFKDVGANVGVLPGLINEVTPPWVVLASGAGMNLAGYLMIYLAVSGRTPRPPVWLMCLYIAVGANSQSFANTGALVTAVKNFPEDRGVVLGLLKGFVGLSGAIFTQLYRAIYGADDDGASLVLLMAWLPAAISLLFIPTIRIMPRDAAAAAAPDARRLERKAFFYFLYASIVLAVYLLVMNVVELEVLGFPKPAYYVTATVLLLLIFFPLVIVVKQELNTYLLHPPPPPPPPTNSSIDEKKEKPPAAADGEDKSPACMQDVFRPPARGEDYTILQALFSVDMLVLFVATICGIGGTLTAIDNMGQIGQSLGYPQRSISTFVSLVSIWNYAGRVVAGFAPAAGAHGGAPPRLRRPPPHRARRQQRPLRGVGDPRILLRGAVAAAVRHHLRGVRPQVLLHALQLRRGGEPRRLVYPQRPRHRPPLRPGGGAAAGRRRRRRGEEGQGPDVRRGEVLQGVVPHHRRRDAARCRRVAAARVADEEVLPRRSVRQVQGGRHGGRGRSTAGQGRRSQRE